MAAVICGRCPMPVGVHDFGLWAALPQSRIDHLRCTKRQLRA
jgi:hypothetical protein